ncbi:MAG: hypothetical protein EPO22_01245, partial [Dehalococcoidia bacterium]
MPAGGPTSTAREAGRTSVAPAVARYAAVAVLLALCGAGAMILFTAGRPAISSDESLYLSEAVNIANGRGPVYTTGEPIVHRAFLFPTLIAVEVKASGADSASVYWLPRLAAIAAACALGFFIGRAFGATAGVAASALALASAQVDRLGNSLYVDVTESLFVLLALLALSGTLRGPSVRAYGAAGVLLARRNDCDHRRSCHLRGTLRGPARRQRRHRHRRERGRRARVHCSGRRRPAPTACAGGPAKAARARSRTRRRHSRGRFPISDRGSRRRARHSLATISACGAAGGREQRRGELSASVTACRLTPPARSPRPLRDDALRRRQPLRPLAGRSP